MSEIHCGIGKLTKGKRLGTVDECAKKKQIRLYGLNKVDKTYIESLENKKIKLSATDRGALYDKVIKLKAKLKKLSNEEITKENKKTIADSIDKVKNNISKIISKIKEVEKKSKKSKKSK